jgi:LPPG:FO 2-phospho-L-lactate transferase
MEDARPAPGVLEAIESADLILFPPSNPVVSIGTILQVSGIREAITRAAAPVIGVSPIIGGHPVRGMADACLRAIGVETTTEAVARHYGSDLLDGWLVDTSDSEIVSVVESLGIGCVAVPLLMSDLDATAAMAARAIDLANLTRA